MRDPVALYDRETAALAADGALVNIAATNTVSVTNGYKIVALSGVKGGEYYGIAFNVKGESVKVNVFFKNAANKYVHPSLNLVYPDDGRGVVRVPEGGVRGVIVFSAVNGPEEKGRRRLRLPCGIRASRSRISARASRRTAAG